MWDGLQIKEQTTQFYNLKNSLSCLFLQAQNADVSAGVCVTFGMRGSLLYTALLQLLLAKKEKKKKKKKQKSYSRIALGSDPLLRPASVIPRQRNLSNASHWPEVTSPLVRRMQMPQYQPGLSFIFGGENREECHASASENATTQTDNCGSREYIFSFLLLDFTICMQMRRQDKEPPQDAFAIRPGAAGLGMNWLMGFEPH